MPPLRCTRRVTAAGCECPATRVLAPSSLHPPYVLAISLLRPCSILTPSSLHPCSILTPVLTLSLFPSSLHPWSQMYLHTSGLILHMPVPGEPGRVFQRLDLSKLLCWVKKINELLKWKQPGTCIFFKETTKRKLREYELSEELKKKQTVLLSCYVPVITDHTL